MQDKLIFLIGPPRSGSTLLMRMVSTHSQIYSRPEPHLMTPLAHMGVYDNVDKAPYDQLQSAQSIAEFIRDLPGGEEDYLDAVRAFCDVMYGRMLKTQEKPYFLDKTPAYSLILPFLVKVFPKAKYIVLTRHPCSVWDSYAESFFDGDYAAAKDFNPILPRYVPAIARFLRENAVEHVHVRYEDIVSDPEPQLQRIYAHIGVPHEPETVNYGRQKPKVEGGLGDPLGVNKHSRPVTSSMEKWAQNAATEPGRVEILREICGSLHPDDVRAWGYDPATLFEPLDRVDVPKAQLTALEAKKKEKWDRYRVQRRALVVLRRDIHKKALGKLLTKVRFFCDVLLRGGGESFNLYKDLQYGERGALPKARRPEPDDGE